MRVWGIAPADPLEKVEAFVSDLGITFPVLYDEGGLVASQYNPGLPETNTVFPQDWIVGVDGTIVYVNNAYEVDAMRAILDDQLAQSSQ